MPAPTATDDWILVGEASYRLAVSPWRVARLAAAGHITTRRLPGCAARYSAADVAALAERYTVPASPRPRAK